MTTAVKTIPVAFVCDAPEADLPVICQCMEGGCVCRRVDPQLNYRTSSLLICQRCCEDRHVYPRHKHVYRCECGKAMNGGTDAND